MSKSLISEQTIIELSKSGTKTIHLEKGSVITQAAIDRARQLGVRIEYTAERHQATASNPKVERGNAQVKECIAISSDHGGFELKAQIRQYLEELGYKVVDLGTYSSEPCDYPEFAYLAARMVSIGEADRGIIIDSVGLASAIVANKIPGIRAVCCWNEFSARSSREHNNANILTLGGKVLGNEVAKSIVKVWIETWFGGGRHQKRVDKITEIEKRIFS